MLLMSSQVCNLQHCISTLYHLYETACMQSMARCFHAGTNCQTYTAALLTKLSIELNTSFYSAYRMHPLHQSRAPNDSLARNITKAQQLGSALCESIQQAPLLLLIRYAGVSDRLLCICIP